jgi:group I intron endonuclease
MFIYKITNKINDKTYIGQTIKDIKKRWSVHCSSNSCTALKSAIQKYGPENFTIEEIDGANSLSELNYKEWLLIHKFNSLAPNGYNIREGGGSRGKWHKDSIEKMKKSQSKAQKKRFANISLLNKHKKSMQKRWLNSKNRENSSINHGGKFFQVIDRNSNKLIWEGINMTDCANHINMSKGNMPQYLKNTKRCVKYIFRYKNNL